MVKKFTPLFLSLLFFFGDAVIAQQIQLYNEDFNGVANTFDLNSASSVGTNSGSNKWVINNDYDGNGLYPDTPDENQTSGGTIAGAPFSKYLHINDVNNTATAANATYDPNTASDRMAIMNTSFCTLGLTDVTLAFFYLCEGTSADYGQLYYSLDGGGSWIQIGQPKYNNTSLWNYEVVTDPAFNNQIDVRFAFRWVNGTGAAASNSFSIDDIFVVGTYDNVNNPVTISITSVFPDPVCQGGVLSIFYELSAPLCDGDYLVEMSNASGSFASPYNLGAFTIYANQTTGGVGVQIPSFVTPGSCYEIRITRLSPPPMIVGTASICFEIQVCPNVITTLQPPVTFGPDTLCTHSVIDVPFYSTGVFNFNNQYVAELSDASGSFASPQILGSSPDAATYDPLLGSLPGSVSGLIPTTIPGCNYYVRVRSTNPVAIGSSWGPFCIRNCDVTTNNLEDISVCISDNVGVDTTIDVDINTWSTGVTYGPANQFQVQVLNSSTYAILNTGSLGVVNATTSTSLTLSIPGLLQLIPILGAPGYGTYYMRIVATDVTPPSQNFGTLVHLTIGAPDSIAPLITPDDTLICSGDLLAITISPYDYGSQYQWYSPNVNGGTPFIWGYNPLLLNFSGAGVGLYWFTVREFNNGCWGPWADTVYVNVIATPATGITGSISVCEGDTLTYQVPFYAGTYYQWASTWGNIIDTSNNEITVVFDSTGIVNLTVFALNECGSANGTKIVSVHPIPDVTAPPDTAVCPGVSITLNATSTATANTWSAGGITVSTTNPAIVTPVDTSTEYVVQAVNTFGCDKMDTTIVTLLPAVVTDASAVDITCSGSDNGQAAAIPSGGTPPYEYEWNTSPPKDSLLITGLAEGSYTVTVTDSNGCKASSSVTITNPPAIALEVTSTAETHYQASDGTATVFATGGTEPYSYSWNTDPGQNTSTATGLKTGWYEVEVTDANGCKVSDSVYVDTAPNTLGIPNAFTPNGDGLNDVFQVAQNNVASFSMQIFNRWGQMLFNTTDVSKGWDGFFNGKTEQIGVYVYIINVTFLDGASDSRKGNLTLLK